MQWCCNICNAGVSLLSRMINKFIESPFCLFLSPIFEHLLKTFKVSAKFRNVSKWASTLVHFISFCFLDPLPPSTLKGIDAYSEIIQARAKIHPETKRYSVRLLWYSRQRFRAEITFCFLCYLLLTCLHQIPERTCNLKMAEVSPVFNCPFSGPIDHGSICNILVRFAVCLHIALVLSFIFFTLKPFLRIGDSKYFWHISAPIQWLNECVLDAAIRDARPALFKSRLWLERNLWECCQPSFLLSKISSEMSK